MPVFTLFRLKDKPFAQPLIDQLREQRLVCLTDPVNLERQSNEEVVCNLVDRVKTSSHLLMILAVERELPWWVPLALGAACATDCRVVLYRLTSARLPDYLVRWPTLTQKEELAAFVDCYRRDQRVAFSEARNTYQPIDSCDAFRRSLFDLLKPR